MVTNLMFDYYEQHFFPRKCKNCGKWMKNGRHVIGVNFEYEFHFCDSHCAKEWYEEQLQKISDHQSLNNFIKVEE